MTAVSLTDLKAKREAMTQGEWAADRVPGFPHHDVAILANVIALELDSNGKQQQIADCYDNTLCPDKQCEANATGIVATHNAADVLIAVTEAALAWRDKQYGPNGEAPHDVLLAALAKITP